MREARCDVLVLGGGVCGLWTLHALLAAGYDAWLLEKTALGDGQTIASQGILHAGAKYRLPGNAVDASRAVADVQAVWRTAMAAEAGEPDLSQARVIERRTSLWTLPSLGSRIAAKGAAGVLRSCVRKLERDERPGVFAAAPAGVEVYETDECVLDPASLVDALRSQQRNRVRLGQTHSLNPSESGVLIRLDEAWANRAAGAAVTHGAEETFGVLASAVVLAAGVGNEGLISACGGDPSAMQRRPLHQLVAIGAPFDLNGHCLQLSLDKPALTVTTGVLNGERTWCLGGGPSEEGVGRSKDEQIEAGRAALTRCLPWVDSAGLRWEAFTIDRAEGQNGGKRPADAVATWVTDRALAVWPTKLVLAPRAAAMVVDRLRERGIEPSGPEGDDVLGSLPEPGVAARVW